MLASHVICLPGHEPGSEHWIEVEINHAVKGLPSLLHDSIHVKATQIFKYPNDQAGVQFLGSMGGEIQDPGASDCKVTGGTMVINGPSMRGLGLGTYLQNIVIEWVKTYTVDLTIRTITLSAVDASTQDEADRRNKFYTQFGITFNFSSAANGVVDASGTSKPTLLMSDLSTLTPGSSATQSAIRTMTYGAALREIGVRVMAAKCELALQERINGRQRDEISILKRLKGQLIATVAILACAAVGVTLLLLSA